MKRSAAFRVCPPPPPLLVYKNRLGLLLEHYHDLLRCKKVRVSGKKKLGGVWGKSDLSEARKTGENLHHERKRERGERQRESEIEREKEGERERERGREREGEGE